MFMKGPQKACIANPLYKPFNPSSLTSFTSDCGPLYNLIPLLPYIYILVLITSSGKQIVTEIS